MGQRTVCLEDLRAWRLRLRQSHLHVRIDAHTKFFERRERAGDAEMAGGVSMTGLQNPQTLKQRDVDSRRFVAQEAGRHVR